MKTPVKVIKTDKGFIVFGFEQPNHGDPCISMSDSTFSIDRYPSDKEDSNVMFKIIGSSYPITEFDDINVFDETFLNSSVYKVFSELERMRIKLMNAVSAKVDKYNLAMIDECPANMITRLKASKDSIESFGITINSLIINNMLDGVLDSDNVTI